MTLSIYIYMHIIYIYIYIFIYLFIYIRVSVPATEPRNHSCLGRSRPAPLRPASSESPQRGCAGSLGLGRFLSEFLLGSGFFSLRIRI